MAKCTIPSVWRSPQGFCETFSAALSSAALSSNLHASSVSSSSGHRAVRACYEVKEPSAQYRPSAQKYRSAIDEYQSREALFTHLLPHLDHAKRRQLQQVLALLLNEDTDEPREGNWRGLSKAVKPSMLILFGSHARENAQESALEGGRKNAPEPLSDPFSSAFASPFSSAFASKSQPCFDLLAIVKNDGVAKKIERKDALFNALRKQVETPVHLIVEDIHSVNRALSRGIPFYTDLLHEGKVLYDTNEYHLAHPFILSPSERYRAAQADFEHWFSKALILRKSFTLHFLEQDYSEAAFLLHQIAERLYGAMLLVFSRYNPSSHDLRKLGLRAASLSSELAPKFLAVFPQTNEFEQRCFSLLRSAYVNARYKPSFVISHAELTWLSQRVWYLQVLVEQCCRARIASYSMYDS
ncbi:HEPN domain-containing protein [Marinomonas agarivorans]|nr:HEPN domain-containing protein [Marinomonas agarivorans]